VIDIRSYREALRLSQSRLARISGVSRFKICTYELGEGRLSSDEQKQIRSALQAEADRLHIISTKVDLQLLQNAERLIPRARFQGPAAKRGDRDE
jgi:transcriptional regulator with XRE-family HTH domain